jgi:cellulose synthase/poly-beta-1,6-N-acetylglucosamine synthase-like glycosyltransferase
VSVAAGIFAGLAVAFAAWSYLAYPALIERLARKAAAPGPRGAAPSGVEVILSAADEEDVIEARVRNLLEQDAAASPRITVGCDGCRDRTAALARTALGERGKVVEFETRRGKAAVLNDLVAQSSAEVIVFTDANTRFEPGAVRELLHAFSDPRVGAVCGKLILESPRGEDSETAFWDRETRLKEAEGKLGVCLGANGAIYAARRGAIDPLPAGAILDDFLVPVRIARKGMRVEFAGNAVAREETGRDAAAEVARRFRIGTGAAAVLTGEPWLFRAGRHGLLTLAFLSRKFARWTAPVLALAAALAAVADARLRPFGIAILALAAALLLLAAAGARPPGLAGRLYHFGVVNVALAAGVVAGLLGLRRPAWRRTR